MTAHLGPREGEVHDAAQEVLHFWFEWLTPAQHFAKDEALDVRIIEQFHSMRENVLATDALGWRDKADHLLAAIILLDQFSRNMFRGSAQTYAADTLALSLALTGIKKGWDEALPKKRAQFLLMPLMHAEDRSIQALSVMKFEALGLEESARYAREHRDVIERFGRFPSRNLALERVSTPSEVEYLSRPDAGW